MDKRAIIKIIDYLKKELRRNGVKISGIALFGSQLSNSIGDKNDIDLIIISDEFKNKNIFKRGDITMEAELSTLRKFMIPMDVLKMTREEFNVATRNKRYNAQLIV